jgi:hypothetical protein
MKTKFTLNFTYRGHRGDEPETETVTLTDLKRIVRAIKSPNFMHARHRNWCGGVVTIYHRDTTSPSGVIGVAGGRPDLVDPLIRKYRDTSPLSPTEGLCAPSRGQG